MTAENLKDELCLYLPMPEQDADFLLGIISATLRDIMSTVSGQFMIHDEGNNQYYIDVNKVVDYDEKIRQRASLSLLDNDELNRYDLVKSENGFVTVRIGKTIRVPIESFDEWLNNR